MAKLADGLAQAGCQIERKVPRDFDFASAWKTFGELIGFNFGLTSPRLQRLGFRLLGARLFPDPMMSAGARVADLAMHRYVETLTRRDPLIAALDHFLSDLDAWLCPVAPGPAFPHCKPGPIGEPVKIEGQMLPYWTTCASYTSVFNLTGHPVIVLPLAQSEGGLPIGVQVVGARWEEMALLNVAEGLTEVTGPVYRPPGYGVAMKNARM